MSSVTESISSQLNSLVSRINSRPRDAALTTSAISLTLILGWVLNDFRAWKSFGTGGTPPTWAGYWRMTKIRFNRLLLFGKDDLRDPSPLSPSGPSYLDFSSVPYRQGKRPSIMSRTMPQRQVPYKPGEVDAGVESRVAGMMASFAAQYPDLLELKPSKTEGGSAEAIYGKSTLTTLNEKAKVDKILTSEIAHAHPSEGSLHIWLSQADAKIVVEKGWGERFPLAFVDKGWTMVYAPRTASEVDVVESIVKAGIGWITGVKV